MKVGDRVRVKASVVVYHHPEHRNEPFDIKGMEGELRSVIRDWNGRPISANYPFLVQFEGKFRSHLHESEIELVSESEPVEAMAAQASAAL
jgi:hypothetical protein